MSLMYAAFFQPSHLHVKEIIYKRNKLLSENQTYHKKAISKVEIEKSDIVEGISYVNSLHYLL